MTASNNTDQVFQDFLREPRDSIIRYDTPPLARVLAFQRRSSMGFYDPLTPLKPDHNKDSVYHSDDDIKVTAADISLAQEISRYYLNKLVIRALTVDNSGRVNTLRKSTFDRDLARALQLNDELASKEEYFPIIHRLPDFYVEDLAVDDLVIEHKSHDGLPWSIQGPSVIVGHMKFVRKVVVKKRAYNVLAYYFSDQNRQLVRIPVPRDSVILPLMTLLENAKSFIMTGNTLSKHIHRDYRDFDILEPAGSNWNITDLEM